MAALSAGGWARWPTVLERYYTTYTTSNHQLIHQHSNGLILLGVSPSHPQLQPPRRVVEVAYRSGDGKSLANLAVSGKKKSGASFFTARDMVCAVTVDDGSSFTVYACVRGSVIEVNERLRAEPQLLGTAAGFIAVLAPKADEKKSIGQALVEFDQGTAAFSAPSGNEKRRLDGKQVRSSGNKKARREKAAGSDVCFAFQRTGECRWGDKCRYSHIVDARPPVAAAARTSQWQSPRSRAQQRATPPLPRLWLSPWLRPSRTLRRRFVTVRLNAGR